MYTSTWRFAMKRRPFLAASLCLFGVCGASVMLADEPFVRVSPRDNRYFELSDGKPYIPIGLNMIAPPGRDEKQALATMDDWMGKLSANGGNYIRLWLSNPFFDVEHTQSGVYDEEKAKRIDAVLALARKYNIRVKMTLEHFRHLGDGKQTWAGKPLHQASRGGPARDIVDFFANPASREQFQKKLDWYAKRYGDDPTIFAWELWNEFNAVQDMWKPEQWREGGLALDWTRVMLDALHERFPKNLSVQSLGSFDNEPQHGDVPDLLPDPRERHRPSAPLPRPGGQAGGLSRPGGYPGRRRRADPVVLQLRQARCAGGKRGGRAEPQRSVQALRPGQGRHHPARYSVRTVLHRGGGIGPMLALGLLRGQERSVAAVPPDLPRP